MLLIYPVDAVYKIGQPLPIYTIPMDLGSAANESFSDFQWWAYSSDFKKWLEKNPRNWVADSVDNSQYNELTQMMIESSSVRYEWVDVSEGNRISKFQDFVDYNLNEENPRGTTQASSGSSDEEVGKQAIKLHFAYNKLKSEGKLNDDLSFKGMAEGSDMAVLAALIDQETGEAAMQSLIAYRMSPIKGGVNPDSKIAMITLSEKLPGGPLGAETTSESLAKDALSFSVKAATYGAIGLMAFGTLKWAAIKFGEWRLARAGFKAIQNLTPAGRAAVTATKAAKDAALAANAIKGAGVLKGVKSFWTSVSPVKAASFWGKIGKAGVEGARLQKTLGGMEGAGMLAKGVGMSKGFFGGVKSAASAAKAAEWTNPIGWALAATQAIGGLWNWYGDKQAPLYKEVGDFAKGSFDPKSIEIGVPITICWSQEAGGWGAVVSFLYNNDTRTTMELVKVSGDAKGYSVFIITQINSKGMQEQMAKAGLTLIAFDNGDVVERGMLDNEDLDFKIWAIQDIKDIAKFFMFEGYCNWGELLEEYRKSPDQLIISDPKAPEKYNFYFADSEDGIINVSGKKVTDEDLSKYSDSDLQRIFSIEKVDSQFTPDSKKNVSESIQSSNIERTLSFTDFHNTEEIFEEDENDTKTELTPEQMSTPAEIAVYIVTDKEYADPELKGKYEPGKFTNFVVDTKDYTASEGEKIKVEVNTTEVISGAKAGIYTFNPEPEVKNEKPERKIDPLVGDDKDDKDNKDDKKDGEDGLDKDYYVTVDPDDVKVKNRRHSTIIRDKNIDAGVNVFDKFLSERDREILRIQDWKGISSAKEIRDNRGDTIIVKLVNREAPWGDRRRKYKITDGEPFEIAKKFVEETKDRIKYD